MTPRLGVNIDHVATLRQARGVRYPDPVAAAALAELGGAGQITIHLREDRRHIQDRDLRVLLETVQVPLNLEMAATDEMVRIACEAPPEVCTLVPEKRQELTTEGGLDVAGQETSLAPKIAALRRAGILVSLFIDPERAQLEASKRLGVPRVELHTGRYAEARSGAEARDELHRLVEASHHGAKMGLEIAAGHGLHYENVGAVAAIPEVMELNIGHSIVARAVFVGLERAVREMVERIRLGRA